MSLRDEITAEVSEAFSSDLADAVSAFTGSRFEATGLPDPISQEVPGETIRYSGRGVFGSFGIKVSEELNILRTDIKLIALQAEVTNAPKVDDEIERNSVTYQVIHVSADPVAATWVLQLRRV